MDDENRVVYKMSKPVLVGILSLALILMYGNLSSVAYILGFTLFSVLIVLDYCVQWENEKRGKSN